jgi:hypothetical protein
MDVVRHCLEESGQQPQQRWGTSADRRLVQGAASESSVQPDAWLQMNGDMRQTHAGSACNQALVVLKHECTPYAAGLQAWCAPGLPPTENSADAAAGRITSSGPPAPLVLELPQVPAPIHAQLCMSSRREVTAEDRRCVA